MIVQGSSHTRVSSSHGYVLVAAVRAWLSLLEVRIYEVKITTIVILTEIENAKVLTKTFTRRLYFLLFLLRVLTKTFHPKPVTPILWRCYL